MTISNDIKALYRGLPAVFGTIALAVFEISACATTPQEAADDASITSNVRTLLGQHPELGPPNDIDVETKDHVVYLSGEVSAGEMRREAAAVAQNAPGVTRVVNNIGITK